MNECYEDWDQKMKKPYIAMMTFALSTGTWFISNIINQMCEVLYIKKRMTKLLLSDNNRA